MYNMTPEERDKSQKKKKLQFILENRRGRSDFFKFQSSSFLPVLSTSDSSYVEVSQLLAE